MHEKLHSRRSWHVRIIRTTYFKVPPGLKYLTLSPQIPEYYHHPNMDDSVASVSTKAAAASLTTIPLELRLQIYHCLMPGIEPLETPRTSQDLLLGNFPSAVHGLIYSCRTLYVEASEYYFDKTILQVSMDDFRGPASCGNRVPPRYLKRVRRLHVHLIIDCSAWAYPVLRIHRFIDLLLQVKDGEKGLLLDQLLICTQGWFCTYNGAEDLDRRATTILRLFDGMKERVGSFRIEYYCLRP